MDNGKVYGRVLWPVKQDKMSFRVRLLTHTLIFPSLCQEYIKTLS